MALKNVRLRYDIASKAKVSKSVVKSVSTSSYLAQSKAAIDYIMSALKAQDNTLYTSMNKTLAEASSELAQMTDTLKRRFTEKNSFACCFEYTTPFIINNGKVISFKRTNVAEMVPFAKAFADAMGSYMASTLEPQFISRVKGSAKRVRAINVVSTNLSAVDTKIASIVSTY